MARQLNFIKQTEGATAVIIALSLFALIAVASLVIDMGQLYTVRNQLQNVADAAALAGAGQLIQKDASGNAVWDITPTGPAQKAVKQVAHDQAVQDGLGDVTDDRRDDLNIVLGTWNIKAGDPSTAFDGSPTFTPNAIQVTIRREAGTVFGPVTSIFAQALGHSTSAVSASATAYLGYTNEVQTGAIEVPLALPISGANSPLVASNGRAGWLARLFGPEEAVASAPKKITFRDTGGANVNTTVNNSPTLDSNQPYWYTVGQNDDPNPTINAILTTVYAPNTSTVKVGDLRVGQPIYPRSEFKYGEQYIGPMFQNLQKAYYYKTTGSATKAPAPGTVWRTTMAVYGMQSVSSLPRKTGLMSLARLLTPFWPSEAFACYTVPPPQPVVKAIVNVDVIGVTYTASCDDCGSWSGSYKPAKDGINYANVLKCLQDSVPKSGKNGSGSVWNTNYAEIQPVISTNTVSPPGSLSGGPSANTVNPGAPANVGAYATVPRLVK